jgi:phage recombination protein Bet
MSNIVLSQASKLAESLGVSGEGYELANTLKATAFKGQVSDAQMAALLIVASQYKLNPWTKEIYAFPDRQNGIVPVVGVDGWARIINSHPQFDGMEFEQDDQACTCIMHRKDRSRPVRVTEFMAECRREGVGPWKSHPKRMLRHKAMIQCARLAFGFGGIYDQDEAERINESSAPTVQHMGAADVVQEPASPELVAKAEAAAAQGMKAYQQFWGATVPTDRRSLTAAGHHERLKRAAADSDAARTVEAAAPQQAARGFDEVLQALCSAATEDELYEAGASLHDFEGDDGRLLELKFSERLAQIRGEA